MALPAGAALAEVRSIRSGEGDQSRIIDATGVRVIALGGTLALLKLGVIARSCEERSG